MGIIDEELRASIQTKQSFLGKTALAEQAGQALINALKAGKKVLICGNGGSASDAQHFAAELVVRFEKERRHLPALALHANTSSLTAAANDYSYDEVYSVQLEAFGREGDVLVGISTSGNSKNIIKAVQKAKELGLVTITLNGKDGGKMRGLADFDIIVPSQKTKRVQEVHITLIHAWCTMIDEAF